MDTNDIRSFKVVKMLKVCEWQQDCDTEVWGYYPLDNLKELKKEYMTRYGYRSKKTKELVKNTVMTIQEKLSAIVEDAPRIGQRLFIYCEDFESIYGDVIEMLLDTVSNEVVGELFPGEIIHE